MTLLICRTCPRYDPRTTGDFGRRLTAALAQIARNEPDNPVAVRNVQCLGGCPDDGVVAVDGPGKARVRFTGLDETDAKAVHAAAVAHDACTTGAPEDWQIPAELADRISSVTRKRGPGASTGAPVGTRPNPLAAGPSTPTGADHTAAREAPSRPLEASSCCRTHRRMSTANEGDGMGPFLRCA